MSEKLDQKTRRPVHLICRARFIAANDIELEAGDYNGFTIKTFDGEQRTFLLLSLGDVEGIDVTDEMIKGRFLKWER
jgi:hypothetical protein